MNYHIQGVSFIKYPLMCYFGYGIRKILKNEFTLPAKANRSETFALFNQIKPQQGNRRSIKYETIMEEIKNVLPSINLKKLKMLSLC